IQDCVSRGYTYSDITILAHKNKNIVEISSWLNQNNPPIPFISYSSLDIRERRVIKEIINLLKFLDSPRDNLSFSKFLMGDICERVFDQNKIKDFIFRHRNSYFLYKDFEREFRELWERYFEKPFKFVGYLPIYELLCLIINIFDIKQSFSDESGAVAKLLEIVKDLEVIGKNSLKEFLNFFDSKEDDEYASSQIFELPIRENSHGVNLMTGHKATGRSSKVLIYLVYELRMKKDSIKIYEDNNKGIKVMKINKNYRNEDLKSIYNEIETRQKVNDLNSFYVGLTRAEDELYVIGVDKDKGDTKGGDSDKKAFPVDLILEGEFGSKVNRVEKSRGEVTRNVISLCISGNLNIQDKGFAKLNFEEKRRGEYIHLILSEIYNLEDLKKIEDLAKKFGNNFPEFEPIQVSKSIVDFINSDAIKPFFDVDRSKVFLEKSFGDLDGVIRIDRLIVNEEGTLIVDFKTGEIEEGYRQQLERYSKALKDIYGKKVSGYILYFDKKEAIKIYEC
ncbi:MAG: hypothetical protein N2511_07980, partial [Thermodesulfovibrionales bacterium]|nr:hypothetical protein [Thermodesulfovibrionales bacterium]